MEWGKKPTIIVAIYWPIAPALDDRDDCAAITGKNEWQGKPNY
jgi:hypothetical protein